MQDKKKIVAISLEQDQVFLVKNVSEEEYKSLLNNQHEYERKQEQKQDDIDKKFERQEERIKELESKNLLLAKCIYDNFVDRGMIENDDKFQQMWFDYYFNGCELDLENAPLEYKTILDKVGL